MFSIRNAVLVALVQVGVVVNGILLAGVTAKMIGASSQIPPALWWIIHYGGAAFAVPLVWIFLALLMRMQPRISNGAKSLAFWSGILIIAVLLYWEGYALYQAIPLIHAPRENQALGCLEMGSGAYPGLLRAESARS